MSGEDTRWKQSFDNFRRAHALLRQCAPASAQGMSDKDMLALVQAFEMTVEQGWKMMGDYLLYNGANIQPVPVKVVREAFNTQIIADGQVWMDALSARNLASHTYDEAVARKLSGDILSTFLPIFAALEETFAAYLQEEEQGDA